MYDKLPAEPAHGNCDRSKIPSDKLRNGLRNLYKTCIANSPGDLSAINKGSTVEKEPVARYVNCTAVIYAKLLTSLKHHPLYRRAA